MSKARILVVEDEVIIAMEIENSLKNLGYEVTAVVNTGNKAIHKAEVDKPDLILMDIRIQGDKDGIETAEIIRERFALPVIFSTAYLDEERIDRVKVTMPFGYVLKPIQERDLKVTLEMALYVAKVDAERRKAENELRRSEELLNNTGEMARVGGWEVNLDKQTVYWSNATKLIHEVPLDYEPTLEEAIDYFPGDSRRLINEAVNEAINNGKSYELVLDFLTAKGNRLKVWTIGHSQFENGKCIRLYGTFQDITELKNTEEELRKSEEWFSTTLTSIGDAVITTDINGNITLLNPNAEALTGWKKEEAKGKSLSEIFNIVNESTRKPVLNPAEKVIETGAIVGLANHTVLIAKNGHEIPIDDSGAPIKNQKGEIIGVILVFRDITEKRQIDKERQNLTKQLETLLAERTSELKEINDQLNQKIQKLQRIELELKESEEKYRLLFENAPVPYQSLNEKGEILDVNQFWLDELGYNKNEVVGKNISEFLPDPYKSLLPARFAKFKETGQIINLEFELICKNGQTKKGLFTGKVSKDEEGKFIHTHCVFSPR